MTPVVSKIIYGIGFLCSASKISFSINNSFYGHFVETFLRIICFFICSTCVPNFMYVSLIFNSCKSQASWFPYTAHLLTSEFEQSSIPMNNQLIERNCTTVRQLRFSMRSISKHLKLSFLLI